MEWGGLQGDLSYMDHRKEREAQRRQEDRDLNRALLWVAGAVVLEVLLVLVNKRYFYYNVSDSQAVNLAVMLSAGLRALRLISLVVLVVSLVWAVLRARLKEKSGVPVVVAVVSGVLLTCAQVILVYREPGMEMLFWLVPALAALALVFYLYQREFFLSALVSGLGVVGLWFIRHMGISLTAVVTVVLMVVVGAVVLWLKKNGGCLSAGEESRRVLPADANYPLTLISCGLSLAVVVIGAVAGSSVAYYLMYAMIAWLFALLVFYTVKMI